MCHDEKKQSIIGVLEREEKDKGLESLFKEIPTENFPNLGRVLGIQVYEAKKSLQNFNPKSTSPRHIIIKLSPIKNIILKAAREKNFFFSYKGISHKVISGFLNRDLSSQERMG